jgi:hypothetical protein
MSETTHTLQEYLNQAMPVLMEIPGLPKNILMPYLP